MKLDIRPHLQKVPLSTGNWIVTLLATALGSFILGWILGLSYFDFYCRFYSVG